MLFIGSGKPVFDIYDVSGVGIAKKKTGSLQYVFL
jgi:hypothetical protein